MFWLIFWGLLLVAFDFSINKIDFLPDGIGYLMLAAGCGGLIQQSNRFAISRTLCFVLVVLWLIGFVVPRDLAIGYSVVLSGLNCAMIWQLLGGIADFAMSHDRYDLAQRATNRRMAYVWLLAISILFPFLFRHSSIAPLIFVLLFAMLVLDVMILHLIHRVRVEVAL
jgi:hypothetical protein